MAFYFQIVHECLRLAARGFAEKTLDWNVFRWHLVRNIFVVEVDICVVLQLDVISDVHVRLISMMVFAPVMKRTEGNARKNNKQCV